MRSNWKTKNWNPDENPLLESSSSEEEEYGDEYYDEVEGEEEEEVPEDHNLTMS